MILNSTLRNHLLSEIHKSHVHKIKESLPKHIMSTKGKIWATQGTHYMQYYPNLETREDLKNKLCYPRERLTYEVGRKNKMKKLINTSKILYEKTGLSAPGTQGG